MIEKVDNFRIDKSLMYLVQQTTKEPTADIMMYFYELALKIANFADNKSPKKRINKTLIWHYKKN